MFFSLSGKLPFKITELREKYGRVVRLAWRGVSFTDQEAGVLFMGKSMEGGKRQVMKDPLQFKNPYSIAPAGLLF